MAKLIGSQTQTGNYGEDYLCDKLVDAFDDQCILYRNREVYGREFDVAMLIPNVGVVIFEAKGWAESSVLRVTNGDTIVVKTVEGEIESSPQKQARGYRFAVERRIRQGTGKFPLVFTMVALPQISKDFFFSCRLDVVSEESFTLLKEDFLSVGSLYEKINSALSNVRLWNRTAFDSELMFEVRSLFETDLEIHGDQPTEVFSMVSTTKKNWYSSFHYIKADDSGVTSIVQEIAEEYASGCKIYAVVGTSHILQNIVSNIDSILNNKGIVRNKDDLSIDYSGTQNHFPSMKDNVVSFSGFNIAVSVLVNDELSDPIPSFSLIDGDLDGKEDWLQKLADNSAFNLEQYLVEHADPDKGVIIRAGAGTGKTYTMISRINFVCYKQGIPIQSIPERIVMITFTNEAADQMGQRLRTHFQNYYLITANTDYLSIVTKLNQMQISTIHSYVKNLISLLGTEFGYGVDVEITSTQYHRRKRVSDMIDDYITQKRREQGESYLSRLGMPVYALRENIIDFIIKLHNKSIEIATLEAEDFGVLSSDCTGRELHELLAYIIPLVERDYARELLAQNKIHLNSMMALLYGYLQNPESRKRAKELRKGKPQYMFVDEFQDTDDVQIKMLLLIADILHYNLFLVGDVKQCIYRFRGAKERAFDQVHADKNPEKWNEFVLKRNYRTDMQLLTLYDRSFTIWGNDDDELLPYQPTRDKLIGTKDYNAALAPSKYYKRILIDNERYRFPALFEEIRRLERRNAYDLKQGQRLSAKEKSIAVLVRENWQAELIRKEGVQVGVTIQTNTGGDLYQSTPALDMLVLVNALLHFDESDYLYVLVTSNFFSLSIPKSTLFMQRKHIRDSDWRSKADEKKQANYLISAMNTLLSQATSECKSWEEITKSLRLKPVLQVLREMYSTLKPWTNYSDDLWKQQYYRLNIDLLFEQILSACNADRLTINTLAEHLFSSVVSKVSVDCRTPPNDHDTAPIQCITVHKAKGLEYGHVILPFTSFPINTIKRADLHVSTFHEDGRNRIGYCIRYSEDRERVWNNYYSEDVEKAERSREETRILYVTMTRAIRSFSWISLHSKQEMSWQNLIQGEDE